MCLNNTKALELCNSRRKKMPDPLHSCSEFTRNRNSCTGPDQGSTWLVSSWMKRGRRIRNHVSVYAYVHIFVCMYIYTHVCVRLSSELHSSRTEATVKSCRKKKFHLQQQKKFFICGGAQHSTRQGPEQSDLGWVCIHAHAHMHS